MSSSAVLRNKGCPIPLASLGEDGSWQTAEDGSIVTENALLRFTSNAIAAIEERYAGQIETLTVDGGDQMRMPREMNEVLQEALDAQPFTTARFLIAVGLGMEEEEVGDRMIPDLIRQYSTGVGVAYAIAMGVDVEIAGKLLAVGVDLVGRQRELMTETLTKLLEAESRGANGSADGRSPDGASTNSGEALPDR